MNLNLFMMMKEYINNRRMQWHLKQFLKRKRIFLEKVTMKIINEDPKQKGSIKTMKLKGRKSKLTHELIEKISLEVEAGNYYKNACAKVGISESVFYSWKEQAESGKQGIFLDFMEALKKAESIAESRAIETILADDSW